MTICLLPSVPQTPLQSPSIRPRSHWPVGFYVMTTETGHSILLTPPYTARTLWHVSTGDHSSNSNDCCCGSRSQLMTSAAGWGKCLPCCRCRSVHLSVSKTLEVTAYSGRPADNNIAGSYECIHSSTHPYMKRIRRTPPQSWALCPLDWHGCWPTPPHSLQQSHILGGWIMAPGLNDLPGDRWRGHMEMVVRLPLPHTHTHAQPQKRHVCIVYGCVLVLQAVKKHGRFINLMPVKYARFMTILLWGWMNNALYSMIKTAVQSRYKIVIFLI